MLEQTSLLGLIGSEHLEAISFNIKQIYFRIGSQLHKYNNDDI